MKHGKIIVLSVALVILAALSPVGSRVLWLLWDLIMNLIAPSFWLFYTVIFFVGLVRSCKK